MSKEIRELELGMEDLDQVEQDVLVLEKASQAVEAALREVGRQMSLVAKVEPLPGRGERR